MVYEEIEIGDFMITQITELQAVAQSGLAYCKDKFDIERYKRILEILNDHCAMLDSMSREQQIAWRFQHEEILKHNFKTMKETALTKSKIIKFLTEEIYGPPN